MNNYRLTLIVREKLDEKERKALLDDMVKSFGELKKEDMWGSRPLAYPIAHDSKGYYAHYEFTSEPATIAALDKKLKLHEDVLRYLLLKHEPRAIKKSKVTKKVETKVESKEETTKE